MSNKPREVFIQIRVTEEERRAWKEKADKLGLSLSALVRLLMKRFKSDHNL